MVLGFPREPAEVNPEKEEGSQRLKDEKRPIEGIAEALRFLKRASSYLCGKHAP